MTRDGDTLFLNGEMVGKFIADPIRGLYAEEVDGIYAVNGVPVAGAILLLAEN